MNNALDIGATFCGTDRDVLLLIALATCDRDCDAASVLLFLQYAGQTSASSCFLSLAGCMPRLLLRLLLPRDMDFGSPGGLRLSGGVCRTLEDCIGLPVWIRDVRWNVLRIRTKEVS